MENHSILKEHTLILAGDTVEACSVWQGWPSKTHCLVDMHQQDLIALLSKFGAENFQGGLYGRDRNRTCTLGDLWPLDGGRLWLASEDSTEGLNESSADFNFDVDIDTETTHLLRTRDHNSHGLQKGRAIGNE